MKKVLMFAAASMLLASCGGGGGRPTFGDNEFPVVAVGTSSTTIQSTYPANIKGVQDVEIHPKVQGFIVQINVKEGQTVSAGQVLFVLDNATFQAQVRQAQAQVNTATASLNTAKLTYENSQKLHASGVIGDYELQSSKNNYESAVAGLAAAQASLASAKESLSYCFVKSPAAGVVGSLPFKVGTLVSAANTLTTVSNISSMEVYFSMTEKDMLAMAIVFAPFFRDGGGVVHLCKEIDEIGVLVTGAVEAAESASVTAVAGHEAFEIRTRHQQVNVVVPWDETFVAHRAEERSVGEGITDAVAAAVRVHILENGQEMLLYLSVAESFHRCQSSWTFRPSRNSSCTTLIRRISSLDSLPRLPLSTQDTKSLIS